MLSGIHFLLTYTCNYECDHCFLCCSPRSTGTFTVSQIRDVLDEAKKLGTVRSVYYEGGEPFLYYPIMLEGLRLARAAGFKGGVVTNCYWSKGVEDAALWLGPMLEAGIDDLSLSDDAYHHDETDEESPAARAARAATTLGMSTGSICIDRPTVGVGTDDRGQPVLGGGALLKGRAVETLVDGLPTRPRETFVECKHEDLVVPSRVHVDAFGNIHVCQGVSIGNMWQTPLSEIVSGYDAANHPICGPLCLGGPAELARVHGVDLEGEFVDECHYCYMVRRALIDRFPDVLAPRQVYGLEEG